MTMSDQHLIPSSVGAHFATIFVGNFYTLSYFIPILCHTTTEAAHLRWLGRISLALFPPLASSLVPHRVVDEPDQQHRRGCRYQWYIHLFRLFMINAQIEHQKCNIPSSRIKYERTCEISQWRRRYLWDHL
jgi:hypothetical protein